MAELVYLLCALTSLICTILLLKGYWQTKTRLLLWSGLCFTFLALNNILLFVDLAMVPHIDLFPYRHVLILIGMAIFLFGLIWEDI